MPFGFSNGTKTFQRLMDEVLSGLHFVFAYIVNILIDIRDGSSHKKKKTST